MRLSRLSIVFLPCGTATSPNYRKLGAVSMTGMDGHDGRVCVAHRHAHLGEVERILDLTGQVCPMTFVRTRLALDAMAPGEVLVLLLTGAEPQARVPQTVRALGHVVLDEAIDAHGVLRAVVRKQDQPHDRRSTSASVPSG